MRSEFIHLLDLFESRDTENIALATQLATHFNHDFQQHFNCSAEEYLDLFSFFHEHTFIASKQKIAYPPEIKMFHFIIGVDYVDFQRLPKGLHALQNVSLFSLYSSTLDSIPDEVFSLINIDELFLRMYQLQTLSPSIGKLKYLKEFTIHDTLINALPEEIGLLENLEWLNLWQNPIKTLPLSIGKLENLVDLVLNENEIQFLPPEIGNLKNLKYLSVENNQLSNLPPEIKKLKLKTLVLSKNPLTQEIINDLVQNSEIETIIFNDYLFNRYEHNEVWSW